MIKPENRILWVIAGVLVGAIALGSALSVRNTSHPVGEFAEIFAANFVLIGSAVIGIAAGVFASRHFSRWDCHRHEALSVTLGIVVAFAVGIPLQMLGQMIPGVGDQIREIQSDYSE